MIYVDILVALWGESYEFCLDGNCIAAQLIEEVIRTIAAKKHCILKDEEENFLLIDEQREVFLRPEWTLVENGIKNGDRLILI